MLINYTLASSPWKHPGKVGRVDTAVATGTQFRCFNHKVVTLVTGCRKARSREEAGQYQFTLAHLYEGVNHNCIFEFNIM